MGINRRDHVEGKIVYGTIEGGDQSDPDPQRLGRVRVRETAVHGPNVKTNHLRFVQHIAPTGLGQYTTPRPERPGQDVHVLKTVDGYSHILGIAMGMSTTSPGNVDRFFSQIGEAIRTTTGMSIPPNVQTTTESNTTGLPKMVKEIVEKDEEDRHELYQGLPSHGASPSMAGLINSPVRQVTTARTQLGVVLSSSVLGQLPGTFFSLGNLFNILTSDQKDELFSNMTTDMRASLTNLVTLKQTETNSASLPGNFVLGGMVNPETFVPTLLANLKGVSTFGELDDALLSITAASFESSALSGFDNLVSTVRGLFGEFQQTISPAGIFSTSLPHTFSLLLSLFSGTVSSIPAASGSSAMFGSDTEISDLMERLSTDNNIRSTKRNLEKKHPDQNVKRKRLTEGGSAGTTLGSKNFLA